MGNLDGRFAERTSWLGSRKGRLNSLFFHIHLVALDMLSRQIPGFRRLAPMTDRRTFLQHLTATAGALNAAQLLAGCMPRRDRGPVPRRSDVTFESEGASLQGWLYEPVTTPPWPAVVMAHGFTATRQMTADKYAEALTASGAAVLLFDHRGFGASGGVPRQQVNPWIQARGYRAAISCVASQPRVDGNRIAVWGDSLSGGVALVVGAIDPRVKLVLLQCPAIGAALPPPDPDGMLFAQIRETVLTGDVEAKDASELEGPMPVVSNDPSTPSALPPLTAYRWFTEYGGRPGTGWVNEVTRARPNTPVPWHAGLCAGWVTCPTQFVLSPNDEIRGANPVVAQEAYLRMPGEKELVEIEGGHFGLLYYPSVEFDKVAAAQTAFFAKHFLSRT
jgi:pimeloyl-ACP methyl ester carboxylesterase